MNELQAQLLEEYINQAYELFGAQPISQEQEQLLIDQCWQQVADASYPPNYPLKSEQEK